MASYDLGSCWSKKLQYLNLDSSANLDKPITANVTGTIPKWLKGSLYRNGSGLYNIGGMSWRHLFDGFSVLHRWTFQDGHVTFLSKILDSDHYNRCVKLNRLVGTNFGSSFPDPCKSIFKRFFSYFIPMPPTPNDNTAVNIVEFGDKLFTLTESRIINEVSYDTLSKKGQTDVLELLAVHMGTAHPHTDKDGTMYFYGTCMKYNRAYNFVRVPRNSKSEYPFSKAELIASIPSRWKWNISYTHSYGMTKNYFVHAEQPLAINFSKIITLNMGKCSSISDCFNYFQDEPIIFHVINKTTGERLPITFRAPNGFIFHFINCYEEYDHIVCDVCFYNHGDVIRDLYIETVCSEKFERRSGGTNAHFRRFVLPLRINGALKGENLVKLPETNATAVLNKRGQRIVDVTGDAMFENTNFELPRINYDFNGIKYRYVYGSSTLRRIEPTLFKLDLVEKKVYTYNVEATHIAGEPVFVKTPGATIEDDGVVLCPILSNTTEQSSYMVVLDGKTFKEIGRATTPAHVKISITFHGTFVNKVF